MWQPQGPSVFSCEGAKPERPREAAAGVGNPGVTRLLSDPCVRNVECFPTGFGNSESQGQTQRKREQFLSLIKQGKGGCEKPRLLPCLPEDKKLFHLKDP